MENQTPEMRFKAGAISATVWKNQHNAGQKNFEFYSIGLGRTYKDKEGKWQNTNSFRINDLPKAKLVLDKAYEYLTTKESL